MSRFAILGTRGIPARYGGFETFAEELATRLVLRGHEVAVYCRNRNPSPTYRGVSLVYAPTVRHKYLDTLAHTFFSTLHLLFHRCDAALYCNAANAVFTLGPRLAGIPVALNVDGIERKRKKWNSAARAWYLLSERLATWFPSVIVTDARVIEEYYLTRYRRRSEFIAYGADTGKVDGTATLQRLGLQPGRYFLYVSRLEPENNPLLVRESFETVETDVKLALVGDAPYSAGYIARVKDSRDPRVVMPGAIYGAEYHELQSHSLAYIHATEVGGTHPALIEAMGRGAVTLYLDTPENREAAGGCGIAFTHETLAGRMREVLAMTAEERAALGALAARRVAEEYSWDAVTDRYEALLLKLTRSRNPRG